MKENRVGIVIPYRNLSRITINCLKSIEENTKDVNYEVYLMNNDSSVDETEKVKKYLSTVEFEFEHILNNENEGFVRATNEGIEWAIIDSCTHILMLNNDTIVTDGWLSIMLDAMKEDVGMVGVMTNNKMSPLNIKRTGYKELKLFTDHYSNHMKSRFKGQIKEVDFIPFFCALFKKEMIKEVGTLSEDYGVGLFDDDDYCHRVRKTKWKIVIAKDVYIHHFQNSTFIDQNIDYISILNKNRKIFKKKHGYDSWERKKVKK